MNNQEIKKLLQKVIHDEPRDEDKLEILAVMSDIIRDLRKDIRN